jgi:hypothetical protein
MSSRQTLLQDSRLNRDFLHERRAPIHLRAFDVEDGYRAGRSLQLVLASA